MSPFHSLFSVMYFTFLCCIVGVGALLAKTVPLPATANNTVLKSCLVFLRQEASNMPYEKNVRHEL